MPIKRTHGKVSSIAKLARMAGQAQQAQREQEIKERSLARAQELAHRERLAQFQAQLNEQMDYRQMEFQANRIHAQNQHDFMMEEARRQALHDRELQQELKKRNERDQAIEQVMNHTDLNENQKQEMIRQINLKHYGYMDVIKEQRLQDQQELEGMYREALATKALAQASGGQQPIDRMLDIQRLLKNYSPAKESPWYDPRGDKPAMIGEREATPAEVQMMESLRNMGAAPQATDKPAGTVRVISPDGVSGTIPADQLEQALKEGYRRA